MLKKELIELLEQYPDDAQIDVIDEHEGMSLGTIDYVEYDKKSNTICIGAGE